MHKKALLVFSITCFLITGCYNNAHLRTQKQLTPEEKVFSGSGIVAIGGVSGGGYPHHLSNTGVSGFRAEFSKLNGGPKLEAGPYFGAGLMEDGPGVFGGYDYRKYSDKNKRIPTKTGAQIELNVGQPGLTFHLRPSITTTTTKKRLVYGGLHGILAAGNLTSDLNFYWTTRANPDNLSSYGNPLDHDQNMNDKDQSIDVKYRFNSFGAGLTLGIERQLYNSSFQIQVDASIVNSFYIPKNEIAPPAIDTLNVLSYSWSDYNPASNFERNVVLPMVTGSLGLNFFKPGPKIVTPFEPMPTPQKRTTPFYDPETGGEIKPEKLRFDPETGEKRPSKKLRFNPETGEEIKESVSSPSNKEGLQLAPEKKLTRTTEEIVFMAHSAAKQAHSKELYRLAGVGSCIIWPIGIPLSFLFDILGPVLPITTLDTNHPLYLELTDFEDQNLFKKSYKKKERTLRSASCHNTQLGCFAVYGATLMFSIAADSNI